MRYYLIISGGSKCVVAFPGSAAMLVTWWQQKSYPPISQVQELIPTPQPPPNAAPVILVSEKADDFGLESAPEDSQW